VKTIAIVDDEKEMQFLYELVLEPMIHHKNLRLVFFSDSNTFLNWLKHEDPDLILCDLNMPNIPGVKIAEFVKKTNPQIPFYFVSGYDEDEYKSTMNDLGIKHFFTKPINFNHLIDSIKSELRLE
jgi:CheY-like chemotaxis protein